MYVLRGRYDHEYTSATTCFDWVRPARNCQYRGTHIKSDHLITIPPTPDLRDKHLQFIPTQEPILVIANRGINKLLSKASFYTIKGTDCQLGLHILHSSKKEQQDKHTIIGRDLTVNFKEFMASCHMKLTKNYPAIQMNNAIY